MRFLYCFCLGRYVVGSRAYCWTTRWVCWRCWPSSCAVVGVSALVKARGYPLTTALTVSVGLAQIGEFSFILAGLGVSQYLPKEGLNLILAGSLLSIALNPLVFHAVEPLQRWIRTRSRFALSLEQPDDPLAILPMTFASEELTGHVVLVGYGRVGRRIGRALRERGLRYVVVEENRDLVEGLRIAKGSGSGR